jgi:hypothetical protein
LQHPEEEEVDACHKQLHLWVVDAWLADAHACLTREVDLEVVGSGWDQG